MFLGRIIKLIWRFYVKERGGNLMIEYVRKQGVTIGKNCRLHTMSFSTEPYLVEIGDNVSIADNTHFITHDGSISLFRDEFPGDDIFGKIVIGDNVHIGANCTILPNTTVGNNCIVGAGSVLRGRFPDNSVIVGNPATILMSINVQKLLFRQNPGRLNTNNLTDEMKKPIVIKHFKKVR